MIVLYAPLKEKLKFGILFENVDEDSAAKIGSRRGAKVVKVVKGTPCYDADILIGDIITGIDGREVPKAESLREAMRLLPEHGETVFSITRSSGKVERRVCH